MLWSVFDRSSKKCSEISLNCTLTQHWTYLIVILNNNREIKDKRLIKNVLVNSLTTSILR